MMIRNVRIISLAVYSGTGYSRLCMAHAGTKLGDEEVVGVILPFFVRLIYQTYSKHEDIGS